MPATAKKKKMGRPSSFTRELGDTILERIAGGETLAAICSRRTMPARTTVYRWMRADDEFRLAYQHARELQMQSWGDEIIEIADDTALDTVTKVTAQGREYQAVDQENIQRSRLRVSTRQWLMARLNPALYGDKVDHQVQGQIAHGHVHVQLDDKERARRLATFLLQAGQGTEGLALLTQTDSAQDEE